MIDEINGGVVENLSKVIDARYYLREYDEVLAGNRSNYSSACMSRDNGGKLISEILDYIFTYYLRWSHEQVRDCLTLDVVKSMKLESFIKRIPCPPEILPSKGELYYIAWYLYPETRNASRIDLIVKVYMDVINERITKFPKGYFDGNDGYNRARVLFLTMVREFLSFESPDEMYAFFAGDEGKAAINKYKLTVPLRELYSSPLDYLHDSLSDDQKNDELYLKYLPVVRRRIDKGYVDVAAKIDADKKPAPKDGVDLRDASDGMRHFAFPALFYDDEDGIYVEFPDFPYCCIDPAHSEDEAMTNAKKALVIYLYEIEGNDKAIPAPTPVEKVAVDQFASLKVIEISLPKKNDDDDYFDDDDGYSIDEYDGDDDDDGDEGDDLSYDEMMAEAEAGANILEALGVNPKNNETKEKDDAV